MWIPGLLLFLFQAYLEGSSWLWQNLRIAGAILLGSLIWILFLALLSQAISALVKWRMAASAALLAIFFIPSAFGQIINNIFWTRWGNLMSLSAIITNVWDGLFGIFVRERGNFRGRINGQRVNLTLFEPPLWCSWLALALICAFCLYLLVRKVRAYEVVR